MFIVQNIIQNIVVMFQSPWSWDPGWPWILNGAMAGRMCPMFMIDAVLNGLPTSCAGDV